MNLKKVKIVQNPKSGIIRSPYFIRKLIEFILQDAPFQFDFVETQYSGHAKEIARQAAKDGYDAVVAVGGDGTANQIASALLYTNTALAIVPMGSGNGLARAVRIPLTIKKAVQLLLDGKIRQIDAGKIQDKYFFIVTGLGFDAEIGKIFNEQNIRGPVPYFAIGLREFFNYRPEVFIIKFDDKQIVVPSLFVTIANAKGWGVGAIIAPHAEPDDGILDICIIHRIKFLTAIFHLPKLFTGKIEKVRKYERYQAKSLKIIRERPGAFHCDGESFDGDTELDISVESKALKIIVPK